MILPMALASEPALASDVEHIDCTGYGWNKFE